jgi:riboflavin synthase
MFTGIISDVGEVIELTPRGERSRLVLASAYDPESITLGASISISGVCLTVIEATRRNSGARLAFDVGAETLAVTMVGSLHAGDKVNLERALRMGDELGGHIVSGHVDGIAEIRSRRDFDGMAHFRFHVPSALARFIAPKGSVALEGTSLTVNAVEGEDFEVLLIPHTLAVTAWGGRKTGDRVNIEVDQMARYAARLIETGAAAKR